ncbi:MAG: rhodanese-like domain-containing protein [Bacteroidia bacterium]
MAGFIAENILTDRLNVFYWDQFPEAGSDYILLDVRTEKEFENGKIEGAINIPIDDIRARMHELPKDKPIYIYCEAGQRGYLAQRTLRQNGFKEVKNLSGGIICGRGVCSVIN